LGTGTGTYCSPPVAADMAASEAAPPGVAGLPAAIDMRLAAPRGEAGGTRKAWPASQARASLSTALFNSFRTLLHVLE
jgi:hypothetical protein